MNWILVPLKAELAPLNDPLFQSSTRQTIEGIIIGAEFEGNYEQVFFPNGSALYSGTDDLNRHASYHIQSTLLAEPGPLQLKPKSNYLLIPRGEILNGEDFVMYSHANPTFAKAPALTAYNGP